MCFRYLLIVLFVLCFATTWLVNAQEDPDEQIIEEDFRVTSLLDRQHAVANLLATADQQRRSGQSVEAARSLNRAGRFQIRMFVPKEAVKSYLEALKLLEHQPDVKTRIDSLAGLASSYDYLSRCDLVQAPVQEAINLAQHHKYVAGQADALLTLSDCQNHDDHALAFETSQKSLQLYTSINRKRGMAEAYVVMGHDQLAQNRLVEAGESARSALRLYTELNDIGQQASVLIYLGYIELRKGAWQDAMVFYTRAQSMIDQTAEPYKMGQIAGALGEAFLESGSPDVAVGKYREALEYFRATDNQRAITSMGWLIGQAEYLLGHHKEALDLLNTAHQESVAAKDIALTAYCDDFLGRTYYALGDQETALKHYRAALAGYSTARNAMEKSRVEALIGQVYQQQGELDQAKTFFQSALSGFEALDDRVNESATYYALGKLALQRNAIDEAEDYLQNSIEKTEDFRRASSSSDLITAFSARVYDRYEAFIECLMRKHAAQPDLRQDVAAFEMHELARARSLTELLQSTQTNLLANLDPQVAEREKSLRQSLVIQRDAKIKLLGTAYKREDLMAADSELARLDREYSDFVAGIKSRFPAYDHISRPSRLTLQQIRERVLNDDDTVLLEYALGTDRSYLWAITRTDFASYELPARAEIEQSARDLYESLTAPQPKPNETQAEFDARTDKAKAKLPSQVRAMSNVLLGPVADELQHRRLLIVADGALQSIPFQALALPAREANAELRSLMLDHEIVNEPSASALTVVLSESAKRKLADRSVAVLADPVFEVDDARVESSNPGPLVATAPVQPSEVSRALRYVGIEGEKIARLRSSRDEAKAILSVVPWRSGFEAVDFDANRNTAMGPDLSRYRVVHFATHALIDDQHPELSGIVLSMVDKQGQKQDGFLRLRDIYNLKLPVDLVVLSACQTGLGRDVKGEGLIGLTRGFMYAGASGVVASLWKVDDEATAELMKHFYSGLFEKGLTPAAALRDAQLALRQQKRWQEPYYWAGFVIQGQYAGKVTGTRFTPAVCLIVIGTSSVILLVVIFLAIKKRRKRVL